MRSTDLSANLLSEKTSPTCISQESVKKNLSSEICYLNYNTILKCRSKNCLFT